MKSLHKSVTSIFFMVLAFQMGTVAQSASDVYGIIPRPREVTECTSSFRIRSGTKIIVPDKHYLELAKQLQGYILEGSGMELQFAGKGNSNVIILEHDPSIERPDEYRICACKKRLKILFSGEQGAFYAFQTLRQLLRSSASPEKGDQDHEFTLPGISITDYPKYAWRGFHLDVSRHFFTKEYILELIDWLAYYKFNKLHLHLTDDQGWRIQLNCLPLLTEIGAWRKLNELDSSCLKKAENDPDFQLDRRFLQGSDTCLIYGGFFTRADIREIIDKARANYIEVIPEIDMPGHMSAAISAYPYLSCTGSRGWGKEFSYPICPCKPEVMDFCKQVWEEVADLFPSAYVHLGSDEVEKDTWASSPICQEFLSKQNFSELNEIQNFYVNEMQQFLQSKGKTVIAWDDVIEGKVDSNLVMMYWRDWLKDSPSKCAANGNRIILTPWYPFYISGKHDDKTLKDLYLFDPEQVYPREVSDKVMGIQSCVWTEEIPSENRFEYLVFPRLQALAEVCWSSRRDWESFQKRMMPHLRLMQDQQVHYRNPEWAK